MSQPLLSLCMIVRDSARTLPACLESIAPWVDEMVVVDTGSVDETREIARRFGASVFEFPWIDDFAAARNESLRHATGEWLFWMDSDDTIDESNGRRLRELAESAHAPTTLGYVVQVHCPMTTESGQIETTVVDHVKLFRNDPRLQFEGRIHEQILPSIRALGGEVAWTDLFVAHSGSDQSPEGRQRKVDRDLRILKLDLAERPGHPFVLFNLGMTYADMGLHDVAEDWLRKCLAASHPRESHLRKAYALLVSSLHQQNQLDEAGSRCSEGLALFPADPELLFRRGMLAHEQSQFEEAVSAYRELLTQQSLPRHFTSIDRGIAGYKTRHNLALLYAEQARPPLAELQFRLSLREAPLFRPSVHALAQLLLDQGKLTAAEMLAESIRGTGRVENESDAFWLLSEIARRRGDGPQSRTLLERAVVLQPESLFLLRAKCRHHFDDGQLDEAAASLELLTRRAPDDASAHYNLGQVYSQQGNRAGAVKEFERSLELRPHWQPTISQLSQLRPACRGQPLNACEHASAAVPA